MYIHIYTKFIKIKEFDTLQDSLLICKEYLVRGITLLKKIFNIIK